MSQEKKLQNELESIINDIDKKHVRKIQSRMHECSLKCCQSVNLDMKEFHGCIETCSKPVMQCQNFLQNELSSFQNRIQRCANDCQDQIKDSISSSGILKSVTDSKSSIGNTELAQKEFDKCLDKCFVTHFDKLLPLKNRIVDYLSQYL